MNLQKLQFNKSVEDTSIIIQGKISYAIKIYKQTTSGGTEESMINVDWGKIGSLLGVNNI